MIRVVIKEERFNISDTHSKVINSNTTLVNNMLDHSNLNAGVYRIQAQSDHGIYTQKVVLIK